VAQELTETRKGKGDAITWGLRALGNGEGVTEGQVLEGNEESVQHYTDQLLINELRYGVRVKGEDSIDAQRVDMDLRAEAYDQAKDWWSERLDTSFFNTLAGNTAQSNLKYTGFNTPLAPSANRVIRAKALATDQAVGADSTAVFTLNLIDRAVNRAKTATPPLRPIKGFGRDVDYVMFMHPDQVLALRSDATTAGNWFDLQKARLQGGDGDANALFTGGVGVYNRTLVFESTRVPMGVNSSTGAPVTNTRRAIFCGAQALAVAFGMNGGPTKFSWVEKLFDYDDELGVKAGLIFGMKKSRYNGEDYGTITITTYAAPAA
jgi:N4-gp56 family major capsid protein